MQKKQKTSQKMISYNKVKQRLGQQLKKMHESKLNKMKYKIRVLNQASHFEKDHDDIKKKLIENFHYDPYLKVNIGSCENKQNHENFEWLIKNRQTQKQDPLSKMKMSYQISMLSLSTKKFRNSINFREPEKPKQMYNSLNYQLTLQQNEPSEMNYETYMKFRKKMLETEIEETQQLTKKQVPRRAHRVSKKKRVPTLILTSHNNIKSHYSISQKPFRNTFSIEKSTQQNDVSQFFENLYEKDSGKVPYVDKRNRNWNAIYFDKDLQTITKKQYCRRNKSILMTNFPEYVHKLQHTNIVKWRLLNTQPSFDVKQ